MTKDNAIEALERLVWGWKSGSGSKILKEVEADYETVKAVLENTNYYKLGFEANARQIDIEVTKIQELKAEIARLNALLDEDRLRVVLKLVQGNERFLYLNAVENDMSPNEYQKAVIDEAIKQIRGEEQVNAKNQLRYV